MVCVCRERVAQPDCVCVPQRSIHSLRQVLLGLKVMVAPIQEHCLRCAETFLDRQQVDITSGEGDASDLHTSNASVCSWVHELALRDYVVFRNGMPAGRRCMSQHQLLTAQRLTCETHACSRQSFTNDQGGNEVLLCICRTPYAESMYQWLTCARETCREPPTGALANVELLRQIICNGFACERDPINYLWRRRIPLSRVHGIQACGYTKLSPRSKTYVDRCWARVWWL